MADHPPLFPPEPAAGTPAAPAGRRTRAPERDIFTVGRLNHEARLALEGGLGIVWVQGELSNFSRPSSGHWYFSLKDSTAQLRCAMFRQRNLLARVQPREGQQLLARGRISLYEPRGDYQLIVEHVEDAGVGALQRAFEELRARLAAEGLFDAARKRPLPAVPAHVGVITSPSGAAIRDILHVLARRFPPASVLVYPVPVQGAQAAPAIAAALDLASARAECDVLILARGGGAIEDLQAFNDERVARALARCAIPVISGVGHETDVTIADFVADVRAPTPTAAAQLAVPDRAEWLQRLGLLATRFAAAARRSLQQELQRVRALEQRLQRAHPGARLAQHAQRLDELEGRLARAMAAATRSNQSRLAALQARLAARSPAVRLGRWQLQCQALQERLHSAARARVQRAASRIEVAARALHAVSPLATLERGFAILTRAGDGGLLRSSAQFAPGDEFEARLADGRVSARVLARRGEPGA
jgi:exodeoxyribonuclease VII large subunit